MNTCIRMITAILVLLAASNASADLTGDWSLQINVTSPVTCSFRDNAIHITQTGTAISGSANLSPLGAVCPLTLTGTMNGEVFGDPTGGTPFDFFWEGSPGFFTISGAFTDPQHANGPFSGTYFVPGVGGVAVSGRWVLTSNAAASASAVPASTPWGRIVLIVLSGLGALYYLRRRRTAVS
jgi:hypothetical protein